MTDWSTKPSNPLDDIRAAVEDIRRPRTEAELDAEWGARRDRDARAAWSLFRSGYPCASFADLLQNLSGVTGWTVDVSDTTQVRVTFPLRRRIRP